MSTNILEVNELKTFYRTRLKEHVYAVDGVSFSLEKGKTLGIAGESGCGKSTLALSLMGFYFPPLHFGSGSIVINGTDIMKLGKEQLRSRVSGRDIVYSASGNECPESYAQNYSVHRGYHEGAPP